MKRFFSFLINRHQDILRILLIIITITWVANWFPKTGKFKFEFEKGKPWKYESYIAPFSFAIKKSKQEIEVETESVLESFVPYYRWHEEVPQQKREQFIQLYRSSYPGLVSDSIPMSRQQIKRDSVKYLKYGLSILDLLYDKGTVSLEESHKLLPKSTYVNVLSRNVAEKRQISEFYTISEAYRLLFDTLREVRFLIPLMEDMLVPTLTYDDSITQVLKEEQLKSISLSRGLVQEGEMVINQGTIVTDEKFQVLISLKAEYESRVIGASQSNYITGGYLLLSSIMIVLLILFLYLFDRAVFASIRKLTFILLMVGLMSMLMGLVVREAVFNLYVIPFCIVPIMVRTFFGSRLAIFVHLTIVLISGFMVPLGFDYPFIHMVAGIVAIYANQRAYYWSRFLGSGAFILVAYSLSYFGVSLIKEGSLLSIEWANFGWLSLNALITMIAYLMIPLFEKVLGFVSEITLNELSDTNKPLLKQLTLKAPGTFNHSLQVANLAEAAAYEIGASTILVRAGALYHDIGKMENPIYFIENQNTEVNPHDEVPYEESAKIIIDHVPKGVEMAKKHRLPDLIIDFIRTHHGTSRVEYFYQSFLKSNPDKDVDESIFSYPGPLPYSKETAIVMLADSVEAASRSIKNPTYQQIDEVVDKLFELRIEEKQFDNCGITFRDISTIQKIFKKMLKSIYHVRVAYPEAQTSTR